MRGEGLLPVRPAAMLCWDGAAAKHCSELLLPDSAVLFSLPWCSCHRMAAPAGGSCPALAAWQGGEGQASSGRVRRKGWGGVGWGGHCRG